MLGSAVLSGGILAPVCLLAWLATTPASTAALLLNLEGLFTAVLAWFVFHENVDRRVALGMALIANTLPRQQVPNQVQCDAGAML